MGWLQLESAHSFTSTRDVNIGCAYGWDCLQGDGVLVSWLFFVCLFFVCFVFALFYRRYEYIFEFFPQWISRVNG